MFLISITIQKRSEQGKLKMQNSYKRRHIILQTEHLIFSEDFVTDRTRTFVKSSMESDMGQLVV